jgi:hypothetical protein
MLQRYIRTLETLTSISGAVAGEKLKTSSLGDRVKKCQQAFLAPLPGKDLKPSHLVIALRNANTISMHMDIMVRVKCTQGP